MLREAESVTHAKSVCRHGLLGADALGQVGRIACKRNALRQHFHRGMSQGDGALGRALLCLGVVQAVAEQPEVSQLPLAALIS